MKIRDLLPSAGLLTVLALSPVGPAHAQTDPYLAPNNTWITLDGLVSDVTRDSFMLNYGTRSIIVEMDDGDRDADAYTLMPGDHVIVSGMIDDDFFETTSIEAASVYVAKLDMTYYSSALDEEDYRSRLTWQPRPGEVLVQGRVSDIDGNVIVVDEGLRSVHVDVESMPYNPLDDRGHQMIEEGDLVMVSGAVSDSLLLNERLEATAILKLEG